MAFTGASYSCRQTGRVHLREAQKQQPSTVVCASIPARSPRSQPLSPLLDTGTARARPRDGHTTTSAQGGTAACAHNCYCCCLLLTYSPQRAQSPLGSPRPCRAPTATRPRVGVSACTPGSGSTPPTQGCWPSCSSSSSITSTGRMQAQAANAPCQQQAGPGRQSSGSLEQVTI